MAVGDVYDRVGRRVNSATIAAVQEALSVNFGVDFKAPKGEIGKIELLERAILRDGWSDRRVMETLHVFMREVKWATWTLADWYGVELGRLIPFAKQTEHDIRDKVLYKIGGSYFWGLPGLPLEQVKARQEKSKRELAEELAAKFGLTICDKSEGSVYRYEVTGSVDQIPTKLRIIFQSYWREDHYLFDGPGMRSFLSQLVDVLNSRESAQ